MKKTLMFLVVSVMIFLGCQSISAEVCWKSPDEMITVTELAIAFIGIPYRYGGNTLRGIDCSAFVKKIYSMVNVVIPRTTWEQLRIGRKVEKHELTHGDLVFFRSEKGNHVGIYVGDDKFIHASSRSRKVKIDHLDESYFKRRFIKAVRVREVERSDEDE